MALSEVQQRGIYVKVAAVLMCALLAYGGLSLFGVIR